MSEIQNVKIITRNYKLCVIKKTDDVITGERVK